MKSYFFQISLRTDKNKSSIKSVWPKNDRNSPVFGKVEDYFKDNEDNNDYWHIKH